MSRESYELYEESYDGGGNNSLPNCSCGEVAHTDYTSTYFVYNLVTVLILLPLVSVFGIFSNVVNILVFTRPAMRCSANVYLLALSSSDLLVVLLGFLVFGLDSGREYLPESFSDYATLIIVWILPLGYMAQSCSIYFTVFAAIDCFVKVCLRWFSDWWCNTGRARQVVVVVAAACVLYNLLRFWQFVLQPCSDPEQNVTIMELCPTTLYKLTSEYYNLYMYMVFMTLLPFALLSVLNVLIIKTMHDSRSRRVVSVPGVVGARAYSNVVLVDRMGNATKTVMFKVPGAGGNEARPGNNTGAVSAVTSGGQPAAAAGCGGGGGGGGDEGVVTMVMVVILFLACNTLALIVTVVETFVHLEDKLTIQFMTDTSNLLVVLNSSVNFVIYIFFDSNYRAQFSRARRRRRPPPPDAAPYVYNGVNGMRNGENGSVDKLTAKSHKQPKKRFVSESRPSAPDHAYYSLSNSDCVD